MRSTAHWATRAEETETVGRRYSRLGAPFVKDKDGRQTSKSAYYLYVNRGKRSITLDVSRPEAQRIARELAAKSDRLLENFKVGALWFALRVLVRA